MPAENTLSHLPLVAIGRSPTSAAALSPDELASQEPALVTALRDTCAPGCVILSCAAADGRPLHVAALYAPSGALGARGKGLERTALLARLGVEG